MTALEEILIVLLEIKRLIVGGVRIAVVLLFVAILIAAVDAVATYDWHRVAQEALHR